MTSKKEKRLRALQNKGFSRAAAHNALRTSLAAQLASAHRTLAQLIGELGAVHISSIMLSHPPQIGRSVNIDITIKQARRPAFWQASCGPVTMLVSEEEQEILLASGATEKGSTQVVCVFDDDTTTFSFPCAACGRLTDCGHRKDSRTDQCFCGQSYEVSFDYEVNWRDCKLPFARPCAECGRENGMRIWEGRRHVWSRLGTWQPQCMQCREEREAGIPYRPRKVEPYTIPHDAQQLLMLNTGPITWAVEQAELSGHSPMQFAILLIDLAGATASEHQLIDTFSAKIFGDIAVVPISMKVARSTVNDNALMLSRLENTPPEGFIHTLVISRRFKSAPMLAYGAIVR